MIWREGRYLRGPVHWHMKAAPPLEHACWGRWSILALPDDAIKVMFGRTPLEMMECELYVGPSGAGVGSMGAIMGPMGAIGGMGAIGEMGAIGLRGALSSKGTLGSMGAVSSLGALGSMRAFGSMTAVGLMGACGKLDNATVSNKWGGI